MAAALSNERLERDAGDYQEGRSGGESSIGAHDRYSRQQQQPGNDLRARRVDNRDCSVCHEKGTAGYLHQSPMFDGMDIAKVTGLYDPSLTWDFVKRLKDATKMKLILKGIVTREDAQLAGRARCRWHRGFEPRWARGRIFAADDRVSAGNRRCSERESSGLDRWRHSAGHRRFQGIGNGCDGGWHRAALRVGLAAFGQPGVEAVLAIMRRELETIMRQAGTPSVAGITKAFVTTRS